MKTILTILFLSFISLLYSAEKDTLKYSFSNDFGYLYSKANNINFNGENSIYKKKYQFSTNTSYSYSSSNHQVDQNELLNKTNLSYKKFFINHIFNTSYNRQIKFDNSIGIGYIKRFKKSISVSYAFMSQYRQYYNHINQYKLRHSVRLKFKIKYKFISILCESYYQPNVLKFDDFIIYNNTKIVFFESKGVSLTFSDNINYQSLGTTKLVHSFNIGIGINFIKK